MSKQATGRIVARYCIETAFPLEDAAQVHRHTGIAPLVATHVLWDMADDSAAVVQRARDLGVSIGSINPNCFQDREYWLGSITNHDPAIRRKAVDHMLWYDELGKQLGEHECWKGKSGMVGVETVFPLMISEGHHKRGIPLTRIVELCCYNAAKTFGLYPRKGALEIGADADINVVDLHKRVTIRNEKLHNYSDFTVFEGREVQGWPVQTYLRGQLIAQDGEPVGARCGTYVKRGATIHVA